VGFPRMRSKNPMESGSSGHGARFLARPRYRSGRRLFRVECEDVV
jgi:hypothetical protein